MTMPITPPRPLAALFLPGLHGGGAERVTLNLARGLVEEGYAVDLVLARATGPYLSAVPRGLEVVDLGARRTSASLVGLARYLRRRRPAALLSALNHANVVAIIAARVARFGGKVLVAEHNELHAGEVGGIRGRALVQAMRWTYPRAHGVVAVSEGVRSSLLRHVPLEPSHVQVIYNPVLLPEQKELARRAPAHPYFGSGAPPVVLGIGRLTRQKNFDLLLRAFAEVRSRRDARLVILGEGEERPALEATIARAGLEGSVSLPGFVDDPYAYLGSAAVFVLSSDWEGLPTVLIEALAAGCAVVATDCPSGPDEILDSGRLGRLVQMGDAKVLATAIEATLDEGPRTPSAEDLDRFTLTTAARTYARAMGLDDEDRRGPDRNGPRRS